MRVQRISLSAYSNNFKCNTPAKNYASYPSFKGIEENDEKEAKTSFLDKIKGIFQRPKQEITPEFQKSEEIKDYLGALNNDAKDLRKMGKYLLALTNTVIKMGKQADYKGSIDYDKKEGEKLTFGRMNEEFQIPETFNIWKNAKLSRVYNISSVFPVSVFSITDFEKNGGYTKYMLIDKNIVSYEHYDSDEGTIVNMVPAKEGFYYSKSKTNQMHTAEKLIQEVSLQYNDDALSTYLEVENNESKTYVYDKITDTWIGANHEN